MGEAVIYTRVSTVEQADNKQSLDSQEKACREFAETRDMTVGLIFREEGESAKTADRTKLLEMIEYCQNNRGLIKYVIVYKVDRFARRAEDHLMLRGMLMQLGIQLLSATEPIENSNTGRLMETILAGFAEFDNGVRAERSSNGMRARIEEGGWVHIAPIGYRNVKDVLRRPTLEPDDMAPQVTRLLQEFTKGIYTQKQAVALARGYGVRSKKGNAISHNGVYKMLRNPIYAGLIVGKMTAEPVQALHKPLITEDEHETILAILEGRKQSPKPSSRVKPMWPLRGFIKCFQCDKNVTGSTSRGRNATYDYYHCAGCGSVRVSREDTHKRFEALLERVRPSSDSLRLFREITLRRWNEEFKEVQERRRVIDSEIHKYEVRRQVIIDRNLDGTFDSDTMQEQLDRIALRKAELQIERNDLHEGELEKEVIVDTAVSFMSNASKLWSLAGPEDRQRFQRMIYPGGIAYFSEGGFGTALMGLCYEEIRLIEAEKPKEKALAGASSVDDYTMVIPRGFEPRLPG